ncbi:DUF4253 domain-containing protein [Actinophytocola sp. KF-1]
MHVAAERFAFCPDNIWQAAPGTTLASYAEQLVDSDSWAFWWDQRTSSRTRPGKRGRPRRPSGSVRRC